MNANVQEWIDKAEGDFRSGLRELRARKEPNYDDACFHAQQCAEKYLKAFMLLHKIHFEKIHDLMKLLGAINPNYSEFELIRDALGILNQYAVLPRYPDFVATREEAKEAIQIMREVRLFIRSRMNLPTEK